MVASKENAKLIKYSSLAILVLQNTSLVLFMRFAMTGNRPKFLKSITVFFAEIFKCIASIILVICQEKSVTKGFYVIYDQFVNHYMDALKVLIPAAVYTVQNILLYVAVENLQSATYMVTYQLKILTTAVFTVLVLKRKLSVLQWIALLFLFGGVVIVQYDQKMSNDNAKALAALNSTTTTTFAPSTSIDDAFSRMMNGTMSETETDAADVLITTATSVVVPPKKHQDNSILGFIAVLVACCLSGFAGIYFEKILKGSDVSIWIRNIQLAVPSIFFSLFLTFVMDHAIVLADGWNPLAIIKRMMYGFDWAVWTTITISALGGLIVAVVIKFADNILKAFATSFAIVLNCVLAYFLFDFHPTLLFLLGASLVMGAVYVYSKFPYVNKDEHQPLPKSEQEAESLELAKKDVV